MALSPNFRRLVVLMVVPVLLALGACSSSGSNGSTSDTHAGASDDSDLDLSTAVDLTGRAKVDITVKDNFFEPKIVKVDPGTTITFTNKGNNSHNVMPVVDGAFTPIETGSLDAGMSASITVGNPTDGRYYCSLHGSPNKGQRGAIVVASPTGSTAS